MLNLPPDKEPLQTFRCTGCQGEWHPSERSGCHSCPPYTRAEIPERVFSSGSIPGTNIIIGPAPRQVQDLINLKKQYNIKNLVDVSNDPEGFFTKKIDSRVFTDLSIYRYIFPGMVDHNSGALSIGPFGAVVLALNNLSYAPGRVYLHCVLGLRRAPTIAYTLLRYKGESPYEAWSHVQVARPFVSPVHSYIMGAERWLEEINRCD